MSELLPLNLPTRRNERLRQLVARMDSDVELHTLWECANVNAVERSGITDHGSVHVKIVANIALKLARLLMEAEVPMGVVQNY
jgi:metal-dependent HD superfamily phosphatase/phosphodiesterase